MKSVLASSFAGVAFSASHQDVTVGFSGCGGSDDARVYYGSETGPAISFAHGYTAYGEKAYLGYDTLLSQLADAGYVVIVPESSNYPQECADLWKDQVKALNWLKSSSLASKVDYSKKTGVLGHSMGGGATYHTAAQASSIEAEDIGAAVGMNPQIQFLNLHPITNSLLPIMFTTGSGDTTISPSDVKDAYAQTSGVPKVFANIAGGTHTEPVVENPQRLNDYIIAFFDCHLKSESSQCDKVYKDASSEALCGKHTWTLTECSHANEPSIEGITV